MMKINSIGYGHKIIGLVSLFLAGIPFCLYVMNSFFHAPLFSTLIHASLLIGFLISLFFVGLLCIEFHQDKKIEQKYACVKKRNLPLQNGVYECQACGSRQVTGSLKHCGICGIRFDTERERVGNSGIMVTSNAGAAPTRGSKN